ncbi:uncharacterized protein METZ01_LOCUS413552, partial [marine metagenome]
MGVSNTTSASTRRGFVALPRASSASAKALNNSAAAMGANLASIAQ